MSRRFKILVCRGPDCGDKRNSAAIHRALLQGAATEAPDAEADIGWHSCFGQCTNGPNVLVREVRPGENALRLSLMPTMAPGAVLYYGVQEADAPRILREHLQSGRVLTDLTRKKLGPGQ